MLHRKASPCIIVNVAKPIIFQPGTPNPLVKLYVADLADPMNIHTRVVKPPPAIEHVWVNLSCLVLQKKWNINVIKKHIAYSAFFIQEEWGVNLIIQISFLKLFWVTMQNAHVNAALLTASLLRRDVKNQYLK